VALIYCFLNKEVIALLKTTLLKLKHTFNKKPNSVEIMFVNLTESERFLRNNSLTTRSKSLN
jgi:hypothetical protein